ncbi:MAG: hypothetical protein ACHRHE_16185 [Tepidisphaerales bacterium]
MMVLPRTTQLLFAPTGQYVEAWIVRLTLHMVREHLHRVWWMDVCLKHDFPEQPIDRHWDWSKMNIEFHGRVLISQKVAIITGDGAVQGAMLVSTEAVDSALMHGEQALFVELLFTAPRNRPALRQDERPYWLGVGTELLTWAAWLSRETGCGGRLQLEGSPDYITWYKKRGLQSLDLEPTVFEGVEYTPMELAPERARDLLRDWSA